MGTKLFIGNLSWGVDDKALEEAFAQAGTVVSAKVIMDRMSGKSRGFAFVEMATPEEAQAAIAMYHEKEIDGRQVVVNEARSKDEN